MGSECFSSLESRFFFSTFQPWEPTPQPSFLGVITPIYWGFKIQNLHFSGFWGTKEDSWTMFLFRFFHEGPSEIHFTQVVQFVTKLYPLFGGHLDLSDWKGHVNSPSQKGHQQNCKDCEIPCFSSESTSPKLPQHVDTPRCTDCIECICQEARPESGKILSSAVRGGVIYTKV